MPWYEDLLLENKTGRSVTQTRVGLIVKPSPFNEIKLELGIVLLISLVVLLLVEGFVSDLSAQLAILFGTGLSGMAWLIYRVKRLAASIEPPVSEHRDENQDYGPR